MKELEHPWSIENRCFDAGHTLVCGVDEAGAGPLAGPVYAGAVILPPGLVIDGLNDSKKLTGPQRERLFDEICAQAQAWAVAFATVEEIEELNILNARMLAMDRAIAALVPAPDFALIDGNRDHGTICSIRPPHETVIGGWQKRVHCRGVYSGKGQPGPVCDRGIGPGVSTVRVCKAQGLRDEAAL